MKKLLIFLMFFSLIVKSYAGDIFGETRFFYDVSVETNVALDGITISTTSGGTFTNGVNTNFYRIFFTNNIGHNPLSTNFGIIFTGNTNSTNAVRITWNREGGAVGYVVERSFDAGASFTQFFNVAAATTNFVDTNGTPFFTGPVTNSISPIPFPSVPWLAGADIAALTATQSSHTAQIQSNDNELAILFPSNSIFDIAISSLTETQSSLTFQISSNDDELVVLFSSNSIFDITISSLTDTQSSLAFQVQSNDDQIADILITNANQDFAIAALTATQSSLTVQIISNDTQITDLFGSNNNLQVQANASTATNGQQDAALAQKVNTQHVGNVTINGSIGFGQSPVFGAGVDMFAHSLSTATGNLDVAWQGSEARGAANFAVNETIIKGEFNFGAGAGRVVELAKDSAAFGSASVGGFKNVGINDSKISGTNSFAAGGGVATGNVVTVFGNGRSTDFNNTFVYSGPEAAEATSNNQVVISATNGMLLLGDNTIVVSNNIVPARSNFYSLGTVDRPWSEGFFGPDSLFIGGQAFTTSDEVFRVDGVEVQKADSEIITSAITNAFDLGSPSDPTPTGIVEVVNQTLKLTFPKPPTKFSFGFVDPLPTNSILNIIWSPVFGHDATLTGIRTKMESGTVGFSLIIQNSTNDMRNFDVLLGDIPASTVFTNITTGFSSTTITNGFNIGVVSTNTVNATNWWISIDYTIP